MLIAARVNVATTSPSLGHASGAVTLGVDAHAFSRRTGAGLGAQLETFSAAESGCVLAASPVSRPDEHTEVSVPFLTEG